MPAIPELSGRLSDGVVELRAISDWDIPEILIAHQDDPGLYMSLRQDRPPTGAQLGAEVELAGAERDAGTRVVLTIVQPGSDDCRGRIDVYRIDWGVLAADLAIWVAPQIRRRGIGRRALRLAAGWLFDECGLVRLQLVADQANLPLRHAALAAGFGEDETPGSDSSASDPVTLSLSRLDLG
jgi:RimJ/RimL family protein N-acetyltransferase